MKPEILKVVQELGCCSAADVAEHLGRSLPRVRIKMSEMRKEGPDQCLHITHWVRLNAGVGTKAYYAYGPGSNAERPTYEETDDMSEFYQQSTIGLELQAEWNAHKPQTPEIFE